MSCAWPLNIAQTFVDDNSDLIAHDIAGEQPQGLVNPALAKSKAPQSQGRAPKGQQAPKNHTATKAAHGKLFKASAKTSASMETTRWCHSWPSGVGMLRSRDRVQMQNHPSSCEFGQYLGQLNMSANVRIVDFFGCLEAAENQMVTWLQG